MEDWPVVGVGVVAEDVLLKLTSPTRDYGKSGALEGI